MFTGTSLLLFQVFGSGDTPELEKFTGENAIGFLKPEHGTIHLLELAPNYGGFAFRMANGRRDGAAADKEDWAEDDEPEDADEGEDGAEGHDGDEGEDAA